MKKLFVLFAVITALTVNTFAYTPSYALTGEKLTSDDVFVVRVTAKMTEIKEEDTTSPDTADSDTVITDEVTEGQTSTGEDSALTEETTDPAVDIVPLDEISDTNADTNTDTDTETNTDSDISTDTYTDTETGADTSDGEQEGGIFGGEGTIVFDAEKIQLVSVLPYAPEGIMVEYSVGDGECRFMFYSLSAVTTNTPLLEMQFRMISVQESADVMLCEGLFSNGDSDTPSENVTFTTVYEAKETTPVTTVRPLDTSTSAVTTSPDDSEPNHTDGDTQEKENTDLPTDGGDETKAPAPTEPDDTVHFPTVIAVSAVILTAVITAVVFIAKKMKK